MQALSWLVWVEARRRSNEKGQASESAALARLVAAFVPTASGPPTRGENVKKRTRRNPTRGN